MKIRNLTSKPQQLDIVEIVGGKGYTIYIEANGCTDILDSFLPNPAQVNNGILEVVGETKKSDMLVVDERKELVTPPEDKKEETPEDHKEEIPKNEDKFICDVCGAEFGSARGLTTHKNMKHSEEQNN